MWRSENKRQESVFSFHHVAPRVPLLTEPAHQPLFFFFIQKLLEILFPLRSIPGDTGDISSKWARLAFTQQVAGWLWYHKHHASGKANQVNWIILLMAITSGPTGKHNSLWQKAITLINEIATNYDIGSRNYVYVNYDINTTAYVYQVQASNWWQPDHAQSRTRVFLKTTSEKCWLPSEGTSMQQNFRPWNFGPISLYSKGFLGAGKMAHLTKRMDFPLERWGPESDLKNPCKPVAMLAKCLESQPWGGGGRRVGLVPWVSMAKHV